MNTPFKDHPYWLVRDVISKEIDNIKTLEMSYYIYTPQTVKDSRLTFFISPSDFVSDSFIEHFISLCPNGYETAIHSRLKMSNNTTKHIPMIDMSTGSAAQLAKLMPVLEQDFDNFSWFKSGRSYHGYGKELINENEWVRLMGKLLLANHVGYPHTVDPRWVGHRLIAGYAALRWTKNTNHYIDIPRRLKPTYYNYHPSYRP